MTCDEVRGKLAPYVDSELAAGEMVEVETHLRGCASCAPDALGLLQTKLATRAAGMRYAPSPEFRLRMEKSMLAKRKPPWFSIPFPRLAIAAVAAMALIAS